ncbi:Response regulator receiver domain-containing protein [Cnuella takakiae]|uniref:Response regulator receiver domain-containing protein n=1 Tax=Cnuella takakiae TaxID=1302690 RepID=A0A1M5CJD1_9BACT|nr:response regulator [Cnuella takakiae]OLY91848.1 hypothetical protein BUE76_08000 [Cnuella takakiae]SHF54810.1 Response regulator receiver domain-containing protein [Cnuella takakiae]
MPAKLLSVNANKSMNFVLQTYLSKSFNFYSAQDVATGAQFLRNGNFDILLIDIDFAPTDNLEFVQFVQNSVLFNCPIIILTNELSRVPQKLRKEFCTIILKPFNPVHLQQSISLLVRKQKA